MNNTNSDDNISNDNNSSWLFNKPSSSNSTDINPRMYVLKRTKDEVELPSTDEFDGLLNSQLELLSFDMLSSVCVLFIFIFLMGI